ncbi:type VII toxin-antitoxin system HepT family RNase toxin [Trichloromonas sp.]|uniref:type VII toxin-antitoxin system HepT family RNase toxin n=1 Tax=Trichloromonas sp. TaxID=3069249 RepID=UPI003D813F35
MIDDVLLNKAAIIERCSKRVLEEYQNCPALDNFTHLDALLLNLERACQAAIDMSMYVVAKERLGVPQSSAQAFDLLQQGGRLDSALAFSMKAMVGFRNVAVHEYQKLDLDILRYILTKGYQDLVGFCRALGVAIEV